MELVESETSAASGGGLVCDEIVAFGFGVRFDRGQVRASRRDLPLRPEIRATRARFQPEYGRISSRCILR